MRSSFECCSLRTISGPMLAGVVINFREGRPLLGSLYGIALTLYTLLLPSITAKLGLTLV